jgi:hypothetical protein
VGTGAVTLENMGVRGYFIEGVSGTLHASDFFDNKGENHRGTQGGPRENVSF